MRFLYDHYLYASKDVHGISSFSLIRSLVSGMSKIGENFIAHYAAPKKDSNSIKWDEDDLRNFGLIPHELAPSNMPRIPYPFFEPEYVDFIRDKDIVLDCILTKTYPHVTSLKLLQHTLASKWELFLPIPVINYFSETTLDKDLCKWGLNEDYAAGMIALSVACTPMYVLNEFDKDEVYRLCKKYLSPSMLSKTFGNVHVLKPSFDPDYIDSKFSDYEQQREARLSEGRINIFHGGAVDPKRHVADLINAVAQVRNLGRDVHVHLVTQNSQSYEQEWIHCVNNCNGKDYLDQFGEGDLLWMAADYEGTGLGYMEAVRSGMIPVCNSKALWVSDRIGDEYPFYFENFTDEAPLLISAMVKDFQKYKSQWQSKLIDITSPWTSKGVAESFKNMTPEVIKPYEDANIEAAKKCFGFNFLVTADKKGLIPNKISLSDVPKIMTSVTDKEFPFEWVGLRGIWYMMKAIGFSDTYDSVEPNMERV